MADNYRPGPWSGRRDSATYAPPSPARPPSQRTMSNTEALDPRKRPRPSESRDDPKKRPPSQSPEPGRPQKQTRTGQPSANASPKDLSRTSSVSNGPAREGIARKPSMQLKADLRKEAGGGMRSPVSPLHVSRSGASTPQHTNAAPLANMAHTTTGGDTGDSATNSILTALKMFASDVATQASLETSQRHADQAYQRARGEYKMLESNYTKFPALQEKKKEARDRAYEHFKQAKQQLDQHMVSGHSQAFQNLAFLITSSGTTTKPEAEVRTDPVSRADMDTLTKRCDEMTIKQNGFSTSLNNVQSQLASNEKSVGETKHALDDAATKAASALANSKDAKSTAEDAKKSTAEATAIAVRATELSTETSRRISAVKSDVGEALNDATKMKQKVEGMTRTMDMASNSANEALRTARDAKNTAGQASNFQSQLAKMNKDLDDFSARRAESATPQQGKEQKQRLDQAQDDIDAVRNEFAAFKTSMSGPFALKKDLGDLESQCEDFAQDIAGMRETDTALKKEMEQMKSARSPSKNHSTAANGLDAEYKKRVDDIWNHKIWEDGPKLVEAVDEIGKKHVELQTLILGEDEKSVEKIRSCQGSLLEQITSLEQDLQEARANFSSLSENIGDAGKGTIKERFRNLDRAVNNLTTRVGDDKTPIPVRIKGIESKLEGLQQNVDSVKNSSALVPQSQNSLEEGKFRSQQPDSYKEGQLGNLNARVPDLEQKYGELRAEVDDLKNSVRVDSPAGHVSVGEAVKKWISDVEKDCKLLQDSLANTPSNTDDRIAGIEKELKSIRLQQDEKDETVLELIDSSSTQLQTALEDTSKQNKEEVVRLEQLLDLNKEKIVDVEKSVKNSVSKQAFEHYETTAITPMRNDVQRMDAQLKQLQAQSSRSNSVPAPHAPAPAIPQSPQLPNGIGSPHPNGPERVPTPQQNPHVSQDNGRMQDYIDGIIAAQQHLKQRLDNMVTDDLVKHMSDQMSSMYPEARNFSSAHKALNKRADALEGEIKVLKQSNADMPVEMQAIGTRIETVERDLREETQVVKRLGRDIGTLEHTTATLSNNKTPVAGAGPSSSVSSADLQALRDKLEETTKVARAADILSKGQATRFTELEAKKKQIDDMDAMVKKHHGQVDGLERKYQEMKNDVDELALATAETTGALKELEERRVRREGEA